MANKRRGGRWEDEAFERNEKKTKTYITTMGMGDGRECGQTQKAQRYNFKCRGESRNCFLD